MADANDEPMPMRQEVPHTSPTSIAEEHELLDEVDPIIKTIPVYINRGELGDIEFNIFQFMNRPFYRPYGDQGEMDLISRRALQKTFKMQFGLNKNANYDEEFVNELDFGDDSLEPQCIDVKNNIVSRNISLPPSPKMFGKTADSRRRAQNPTTLSNYSSALGILRNGCVYITPKVHVQQFRPDLTPPQSETEAATKIKEEPIAKGKNNVVDQRSAISHQALWAWQEEEPWIDIEDKYDNSSMQAASMLRKLTKIPMTKDDVPQEEMVQFATNFNAYLKNLTTVNLEEEGTDGNSKDISLGSLSEFAPKDQVKMIVKHYCVATFDLIRSKLPKDFKDEELLDELLQLCFVVQGNFVEKSETVIPELLKDLECPQLNRIDFIGYLVTVRDVLICMFADSVRDDAGEMKPRSVVPAQVINIPTFKPFKAPGPIGTTFKKALEMIFNNISILENRQYVLKLPPDRKMLNIDKVSIASEDLKKMTPKYIKEILPAKFKALQPKKQ